jgi:hypothetical protein
MEPEGSLRHSQVLATCPYPEPDQSGPFPHIPLNIIHPSMPGSYESSLSLRFPHQNPVYTSPRLIRASCPAHLILLDLIPRTILGEQYRSLSSSLYSFSPLPCYLVRLRPKYSPLHPILKHPQLTFLPQCKGPNFTPLQKTGNIIVLYMLIVLSYAFNNYR